MKGLSFLFCLLLSEKCCVILAVGHDLSNSSLTEVPSSIPSDVTDLYLDLNPLVSIPSNTFGNYNNLSLLNLAYCEIASIAEDAFGDSPIQYLYLQGNQLISMDQLSCLDSVKQTLLLLELSYNPEGRPMDSDWDIELSSFPMLTTLRLRRMGIRIFPNLSDVANTLTALILAQNELGEWPIDYFAGFHQLVTLALYGNSLPSFPDFSPLAGNNKLETLLIGSNMIPNIPDSQLAILTQLDKLSAYSNELTTCPDVRNSIITELDLHNNPLACDSRLAWMKQLQSSELVLELGESPCAEPADLVGVAWVDISEGDLESNAVTGTNSSVVGDELFGQLFDGDNSTCISMSSSHGIFHRELDLKASAVQSPVMFVTVVGEDLGCDQHNNGLQFYVNIVDGSQGACQLYEMEMKRCRLDLAEVAMCQYECQCLADSGVCQVGALWKTHDLTPAGMVCEVLVH